MNRELAKKATTLNDLLERSKEQIARALPKHMTPERVIRLGLTAARKNSRIMECDLRTVVGCIVEASQLGLEIDGVLGSAYLVPYKTTCTLIPGYRGLISLARRSGGVSSLYANLVYDCDFFQVKEGLNRDLRHDPDLEQDGREERKVDYVYAVITFTDGRAPDFEVMSYKQIESVRARSKAADSGPWVTDWGEMARKTVIRRLLKRHDLSPEMNRAMELSLSEHTGEAPESIVDLGTVEATPVGVEPKKSKMDEAVERIERRANAEAKKALDDMGDIPFDDEPPADEPAGDPFAAPADEPADEQPPADEQAPWETDRRHRATCIKAIQECIPIVGKDNALAIRDQILDGSDPNPQTMDLTLLRRLTHALEQERDLATQD